MAEFAVTFKLTPSLDVPALNTKLDQIKNMLGSGLSDGFKPFQNVVAGLGGTFNTLQSNANNMASSIRSSMAMLIASGEKGSEQYKALAQQLKIAEAEAKNLGNAYSQVGEKTKSSAGQMAMALNQTLQFTQAMSQQLNEVMSVGIAYDKQLRAVGAFTGTTGEALDLLGSKARELGIRFGDIGKAKDQLEVFSAVLSKMGPAYGQNAEAMGKFAENANVLAKAGGIEVGKAVDVMTNSMLQFGLRTGDANKDAETSSRIINGLAASARAGAAQIPQVGEAILQVGVMAKGAKMSFEETAAAIQVMSVGGKTGAEAGVALRNVIGLMQKPTAETEAILRKMGLTSSEVGDTLTTQGFGAAIEKLKGGLEKLPSDMAKNNAMMKMFGMENAAAAGIFMDNIGRYKEFVGAIKEGQEGQGTAFEMFAQKSGTAAGTVEKWKARVQDFMITVSQGMGSMLQSVLLASTQVAPAVTTAFMSFSMLPTDKIGKYLDKVGGIKGAFKAAGTAVLDFGKSMGSWVADGVKGMGDYVKSAGGLGPVFASASTSIWGAVKASMAFLATPIGAAVAATVALGVGVAYLAGAFDQSSASKLADTEATIKNTETMVAQNQKQQAEEKKKLALISMYETTLKSSANTQEEAAAKEEKLRGIREQLNSIMPETIDLTKTHEQNLQALKETTHLLGVDTTKFTYDNKTLVNTFEELSKKENKTEAEKQKLIVVTKQLNEIFPEASIGTKSFGDSMKYLQDHVGLGTDELRKLTGELNNYQKDLIELQKRQSNDKFWANKDTTRSKFGFWDDTVNTYERAMQEMAKATNQTELNAAYDKWSQAIKKDQRITGESLTTITAGIIQGKQDWENYLRMTATTSKKSGEITKGGAKEVGDYFDSISSKIEKFQDDVNSGLMTSPQAIKSMKKSLATEIQQAVDLGKISAEQAKELQASIAKANAKEQKDKVKSVDDTEKEITKVTDEAAKLRDKNSQIIADRELKANRESFDSQLKDLHQKNENELSEIQRKIDAQQKITDAATGKNKDAQLELLSAMMENLDATKEKHVGLVEELTKKHIDLQQKVYADAIKDKEDYNKKMLAFLEEETDATIDSLQKQLALKKEILDAERQQQIDSEIAKNKSVVQAKKDLIQTLAELGPEAAKVNIDNLMNAQTETTTPVKMDIWGFGLGISPFSGINEEIDTLKKSINDLTNGEISKNTEDFFKQIGDSFSGAFDNSQTLEESTAKIWAIFDNLKVQFKDLVPKDTFTNFEEKLAPILENADTTIGTTTEQIDQLKNSLLELAGVVKEPELNLTGMKFIGIGDNVLTKTKDEIESIKTDIEDLNKTTKEVDLLNNPKVKEAIDNVKKAVDSVYKTNDTISLINKKYDNKKVKETQDTNYKIEELRAQSITDIAEREYVVQKLYADRSFKGALTQAGINVQMQIAAYESYQKALNDIERKYALARAGETMRIAMTFSDALVKNAQGSQVVDSSAQIDGIKSTIKGYNEEIKALKESYKNKTIERKEFDKKLKELDDKRLTEMQNLQKAENIIWTSMMKTLSQTFAETANSYRTTLNNTYNKIVDNANLQVTSNDTMNSLMEKRDQQYSSTAWKSAKEKEDQIRATEKQIQVSYDATVQSAITSQAAINDAWLQTGAVAGAVTMQMITDHQSLIKSFTMGSLAGLKAILPIMIAKYVLEEMGLKGLPGLVTAGIMSGVAVAAVSAAESKVMSMKFRTGGYTGNLPENAEAGTVHGQEYVLNAQATRVNDMKALDFSNRTGKSMKEYYRKDQTFIDEIKRTELTKVNIKEYISTEKHSIEVNKQLVRDLLAEDRANNQAQMQLNEMHSVLKDIKQLTEEGNYKRTTTNKVHIAAEFDTQRLVKLQQVYKSNSLARS